MILPFLKAPQMAVIVAEYPKEEFRVHYQKGHRDGCPHKPSGNATVEKVLISRSEAGLGYGSHKFPGVADAAWPRTTL